MCVALSVRLSRHTAVHPLQPHQAGQKYWALVYFMGNLVVLYNFMGYGTFTHSFISNISCQERYDPF